jgi:hypothetical protein
MRVHFFGSCNFDPEPYKKGRRIFASPFSNSSPCEGRDPFAHLRHRIPAFAGMTIEITSSDSTYQQQAPKTYS